MASLWKLPVIYLCENNGYALTTPLGSSHAQPSIAKRADGYGMPGVTVDGQDVEAVYAVTSAAVARSRDGHGPTLIEARTYRFDEHEVGLVVPGKAYRAVEEVEHYKTHRDPIALFRKSLLQSAARELELQELENEVTDAVAEAVRFAQDSPLPDPATLYEYLYSSPTAVGRSAY
jgi:TPP-dependent pyruvate/acetoin dehydrogenase alpha subunit